MWHLTQSCAADRAVLGPSVAGFNGLGLFSHTLVRPIDIKFSRCMWNCLRRNHLCVVEIATAAHSSCSLAHSRDFEVDRHDHRWPHTTLIFFISHGLHHDFSDCRGCITIFHIGLEHVSSSNSHSVEVLYISPLTACIDSRVTGSPPCRLAWTTLLYIV